MILPLLLAATLSTTVAAVPAAAPEPEPAPEPLTSAASPAPAPAPSPVPAPAGVGKASLDAPITLKLKDAGVVNVLEKLAELVGATPILDPAVGGQLSLNVEAQPISKVIELIGNAASLDVSVGQGVLRARPRAGSKGAVAPRPTAPPKAPAGLAGDVARFWLESAPERAVTVRIPEAVAQVEVAGCAGPLTVGRLGQKGGRFAGLALAAAETPDGRPSGRILGEEAAGGTRVLLPACDGGLLAEVGDVLPGRATIDPVPLAKRDAVVLGLRLLEVSEAGEKSLAEPIVAFSTGGSFSVRSGLTARAPGDPEELIEIAGVPMAARIDEGSLLLAVHAAVVQTKAALDGGGTLVARRAESLWARKGSPVRWTVDSSWDGGRAALVLELTVHRLGATAR